MQAVTLVDPNGSSRQLVRALRSGFLAPSQEPTMPESFAWQTFLELRKRGEPQADRMFVDALRALHARRTVGTTSLACEDTQIDEHRLAEDRYLADLWKAYKRCIQSHRTGPASQLLRDIEQQLTR
jgi:hypothetical protein